MSEHHKHNYGRECAINAAASVAVLGFTVWLVSSMALNYMDDGNGTSEDSNPPSDSSPSQNWNKGYIVPDTPTPIPTATNPSIPTEIMSDNCAAYPDNVEHRDDVCVAGETCEATFFGKTRLGSKGWYVTWYGPNGEKIEKDCTQLLREEVSPAP